MFESVTAPQMVAPPAWQDVETRLCRLFTGLLGDAQRCANVFAVTADAGSGKTFTAKRYAAQSEHVLLLQCNEYWNRRLFLGELLRAAGFDGGGRTVGEMMELAVAAIGRLPRLLIVLDEADKLSDQLMLFFITLYNRLEDRCGIVMCGTDFLEKRIVARMRLNKRGYKEIYSRIGRRFVVLKGNGAADIRAVCRANGVADGDLLAEIVNESEGDLRRVRRKIHALRGQAAAERRKTGRNVSEKPE